MPPSDDDWRDGGENAVIGSFKLLDRYLCGQLFLGVLFCVVLFCLIWLAPETMFKLTQYVFSGRVSAGQALTMFALHLPEVLSQTIPIAVMVGSILLFQRLSRDYELIALLASGIGTRRILASALWVGLLFGLAHAAINELVLPASSHRLEQYYTSANLKDIPDRNFLFVEKDREKRLSKFFMIGQTQKAHLSDFIVLYYVETPESGVRISRILRADTGWWMPLTHQWQLVNGIEYVLNADGVYKDIRRFDEQQVHTDQYAPVLLDYTRMNPMTMSWDRLSRYIQLLRKGNQLQEVPFFEVRLWQKWAAPMATVLFAVLGALLGMEQVRTNRVYGLTFGAIVIFLYSILMPFTASFGALDMAPPALVAWLPLLIATTATLLLQRIRPQQG